MCKGYMGYNGMCHISLFLAVGMLVLHQYAKSTRTYMASLLTAVIRPEYLTVPHRQNLSDQRSMRYICAVGHQPGWYPALKRFGYPAIPPPLISHKYLISHGWPKIYHLRCNKGYVTWDITESKNNWMPQKLFACGAVLFIWYICAHRYAYVCFYIVTVIKIWRDFNV